MKIKLALLFVYLFFGTLFPLIGTLFEERFHSLGYVEIINKHQGSVTFDLIYNQFDQLIDFLQSNPIWAKKLYSAKERFTRTRAKGLYSTDFFGFYDESENKTRNQISFYYSTHFHDFIVLHYPDLANQPVLVDFFENCLSIQKTCENTVMEAVKDLQLTSIFSSNEDRPPILLKVIKYLPSYSPLKPHYDGTVFSLFLDSTDNHSLLFSPYNSEYVVQDFKTAIRQVPREATSSSMLFIPGTLLSEFSIFPTPHIVIKSGQTRFAIVAFVMRPNYQQQKIDFAPLPHFD